MLYILSIIFSESSEREGSDKRFCDRIRPNYFVAVQISNPKASIQIYMNKILLIIDSLYKKNHN